MKFVLDKSCFWLWFWMEDNPFVGFWLLESKSQSQKLCSEAFVSEH